MQLISSSIAEAGDQLTQFVTGNMTDKAQTAVFGIQTPLIMINTTIIDFDAVQYFNLKSVGRLPELTLTVEDRFELINNIDKPGNDNEIRIQLLPKFDNAYKKIDLTFFITNVQVSGKLVRLTCSYKLPALYSSQFKSFGQIDTYSLFKEIAQETQLGFATNIAELSDTRYSYCDNKSLFELMNTEIEYANATDHIIDWWVDLWDNINLVDIKDRYNSIDNDEDLHIWIAGQINETTMDKEITPINVVATLNNHPSMTTSELFVKKYCINNKPGKQLAKGSDKVYGIYEDRLSDYSDYLVQDGDIKSDIFTKYDYVGENYGEYNYMMAKQLRDSFIQKMTTETIDVTLQSPLLALMRGHKVNFIRYVNDDKVENKISMLEKIGLVNRDVETNIPLSDYEINSEDGTTGQFRIDKTVSGQYLILGVNVVYTNNAWDYTLTLAKPSSTNVSIINNQE
jgi:hypothetical protein